MSAWRCRAHIHSLERGRRDCLPYPTASNGRRSVRISSVTPVEVDGSGRGKKLEAITDR